jgi:hypothetical protein
MANIVIPFAAVSHQPVPSVGFNNNFTEVAQKFNTYAVQTDVAKVIGVAHTFSVAQNMAGLVMTGDLLFTDATYDIGKLAATRPRDGFFSRNLAIGGTLTLNGGVINLSSFIGTSTMLGGSTGHSLRNAANSADNILMTDAGLATFRNLVTITAGGLAIPSASASFGGGVLITGGGLSIVGDLLFTDALYDIGKTGATRPRDGFFSRNLVVGGTLNTTGALTVASGGVNVTAGGVVLAAGNTISIAGNNVLGARAPGWAAQTGAQTRADMGGAPTLATVASTLDALIMDLRGHGMI